MLKDVLERDSSYIEARELRATILCNASDYEECLSEAEKILGLDKDNKVAKELTEQYQDKVQAANTSNDDKESTSSEEDDKDDKSSTDKDGGESDDKKGDKKDD